MQLLKEFVSWSFLTVVDMSFVVISLMIGTTNVIGNCEILVEVCNHETSNVIYIKGLKTRIYELFMKSENSISNAPYKNFSNKTFLRTLRLLAPETQGMLESFGQG